MFGILRSFETAILSHSITKYLMIREFNGTKMWCDQGVWLLYFSAAKRSGINSEKSLFDYILEKKSIRLLTALSVTPPKVNTLQFTYTGHRHDKYYSDYRIRAFSPIQIDQLNGLSFFIIMRMAENSLTSPPLPSTLHNTCQVRKPRVFFVSSARRPISHVYSVKMQSYALSNMHLVLWIHHIPNPHGAENAFLLVETRHPANGHTFLGPVFSVQT